MKKLPDPNRPKKPVVGQTCLPPHHLQNAPLGLQVEVSYYWSKNVKALEAFAATMLNGPECQSGNAHPELVELLHHTPRLLELTRA